MVATISGLSSAGQAASYYEADDYYSEGGLSPSEWNGKGAQDLGLSGDVDRERFRDLLDGKIGDQQLGTMNSGKIAHRPGWDVTMSAPKSVSIMAEVAGDRRLLVAHGDAVKTALGVIEKHYAATRIREAGSVSRERTDNLIIASFQHGTSRAQDAQLHTHNVILNATQDADGTWRSLEPRALYQRQKQIGAIYRQELANNVRALGYDIAVGKDSMFEIAGVSEEVIKALSSRSTAIEARLEERGKTRETSSAAEKQVAALDTRAPKEHISQSELVATWRATADAHGFDANARRSLIASAEQRAAGLTLDTGQAERSAVRAVNFAIQNLNERQSVFSASDLAESAGKSAAGKVSHAQIDMAVTNVVQSGELVPRNWQDRRGTEFSGFTTQVNIDLETRMLVREAAGRNSLAAIASPLQAAKAVAKAETQARRAGHEWNDDQREATQRLLTSTHRVTALQGFAGTAKTTTVLATFAKEAEAQGAKVTALAPTASAAITLSEALSIRGDTVARHLTYPEQTTGREAVWIVDEASLLSTRDSTKLFEMAEKQNARVILVGDVKQLGSIEAGAAFAQLQSAGMETAKLSEIVRQTNSAAKEAVLASIEGDAKRALAALDSGSGKIIEAGDRDVRFKSLARDYAALDKASRDKTLVIEPSREGRDTLTADIRNELKKSGALSGRVTQSQALANKGLTRAEAKDPANYDIGDVIRFAKDYADKQVTRDQAYRVRSVDTDKAAITLASEDGQQIEWRLRQWGTSNSQAFAPQPIELQAGDRIQFSRNDRAAARINGQRGEVLSIDTEARTATVQITRGKSQTLSLDSPRDQHIRHAYVETAFAAQGRTADHVMIHADSAATNLVDQKSFYVGVSRAKESVAVYTNDRAKLVSAINERAGVTQTALAQSQPVAQKALKSLGAGLG